MSYLLFLDESGTAGRDRFVLGGVAVEMEAWQRALSVWASEELAGTEVKWIHTSRLDGRAGRLAELILESQATAFAVVVDSAEGACLVPRLLGSPNKDYAAALMLVAERFQLLLERRDAHGLIVIDQREASLDERLRQFFAQLAAHGSRYRSIDRILAPVLLSPSHHALGIQAADIVVGSLYTLERADQINVPDERRALAQAMHDWLLPCFDRHPATGELEGVGIKHLPGPDGAEARKLFDPRPRR